MNDYEQFCRIRKEYFIQFFCECTFYAMFISTYSHRGGAIFFQPVMLLLTFLVIMKSIHSVLYTALWVEFLMCKPNCYIDSKCTYEHYNIGLVFMTSNMFGIILKLQMIQPFHSQNVTKLALQHVRSVLWFALWRQGCPNINEIGLGLCQVFSKLHLTIA